MVHPSIAPDQVVWLLSAGRSRWRELSPERAVKRLAWMDAEGFSTTSVELRHDPSLWSERWEMRQTFGADGLTSMLVHGEDAVQVENFEERFDWEAIIDTIVEMTFPWWLA